MMNFENIVNPYMLLDKNAVGADSSESSEDEDEEKETEEEKN